MIKTRSDSHAVPLLAAAKYFNKKRTDLVRDKVQPGEYEVDALVHIEAVMTVKEDYAASQVNKLCPWLLLQLAWNRMPEHVRNACLREAMAIYSGEMERPDTTELKTRTQLAAARANQEVDTVKRGSVIVEGEMRRY